LIEHRGLGDPKEIDQVCIVVVAKILLAGGSTAGKLAGRLLLGHF
jgi:hypothetical protein